MCVGGLGGVLFLVCSTPAFIGQPLFGKLASTCCGTLSMPVFYLLADILDTNSIPLAILLLIPYWAILGIGFTCVLVWCYFFVSSKFRKIVHS